MLDSTSICVLIIGPILYTRASGHIGNSCLAFRGNLLAMKCTGMSNNFQDKALNVHRYE